MASSDAEVVAQVRRQVAASVEGAGLAASEERLVVAVSGGADSLCLLDALVAALPDPRDRLLVGHVDHRLRPESGIDAAHVRSIAADYGLPCEVAAVDVPGLAAAERSGIEETARRWRYRALRAMRPASGVPTVLTGHTRDDLAETVVMHLLRGSGRRGLGGISADETLDLGAGGHAYSTIRPASGDPQPMLVRIVRPLLGVHRADTTAYCEAQGIAWREDASNADPAMLRNRVRGHLLPVLRTYNPAVDDALVRLAQVMRDEEAFLDEATEREYRGVVLSAGGRQTIALTVWRRLPVSLQRRLIRRCAAIAGYIDLGYDAVERALAVGRSDGPSRAELGRGMTVERRQGQLSFIKDGGSSS